MDRVQRVFIADGDCCDAQFLREQHPDLITIRASAADGAPAGALAGVRLGGCSRLEPEPAHRAFI